MTEKELRGARRVLIYWHSDLRVKTLMGRDERGVAQLETFELREGEFGPGVEFIEAQPILAEREQLKAENEQIRKDNAEIVAMVEFTKELTAEQAKVVLTKAEQAEAEREQMLDLLERWLRPEEQRTLSLERQRQVELQADTDSLLEQAGRTQPKEEP